MAPKRNAPGVLLVADRGDPGKIGEGPQVGAHDRSTGGPNGCGNLQIVSTARVALRTNRGKKLGVFGSC